MTVQARSAFRLCLFLESTLRRGGHGLMADLGGRAVLRWSSYVLHDSSAASPGPSLAVGCPATISPHLPPSAVGFFRGCAPGGTSKAFSTQEVRRECPSGLGRSLGNMLETTFPALLVFLHDS